MEHSTVGAEQLRKVLGQALQDARDRRSVTHVTLHGIEVAAIVPSLGVYGPAVREAIVSAEHLEEAREDS